MNFSNPQAAQAFHNAHLWHAHAYQVSGPNREAALRAAADWSALYDRQMSRASAPWAADAQPYPRFQVQVHKHTGLLMLWQHQTYTVTGTYVQCEAAIRDAQQHNLLAGWWSPLSVLVMNWVALLANASARKTLRSNAAQVAPTAGYSYPHQRAW